MKKSIFPFLWKLLLLTFLLLLTCFIGIKRFPMLINLYYPFIIAFFAATTSVFHISVSKNNKSKFSTFVNSFMAFTMLKLLLYLTVLLIGVFANKANAKSFIITYFISYMLFTAFEVIHTTTQQNKAKKNK